MTTLGRYFLFLILALSACFFAISLAVVSTHINWRTKHETLRVENDNLTRTVTDLKNNLASSQTELTREQTARKLTLATLQTQLANRQQELVQATNDLRELRSETTLMNQTLAQTQDELSRLTKENQDTKQRLDVVLEDRNAKRAEVISLTDKINNLQVTLTALENRKDDLNNSLTLAEAQLGAARGALKAAGIDENPEDVPPSNLRSVVTSIGKDGAIEISAGTDDGIRVGHKLDIVRGTQYIGKMVIRYVRPDKAVGEVIDGYRRGYIQERDAVVSDL